MSYESRHQPRRQAMGRVVRGRSRSGCLARILIALVIIAFAFIQHIASTRKEVNPYTGEEQRLSLTPQQEAALGLQAVPRMEGQYGGLHPDQKAQALVDLVGGRLAAQTGKLLPPGAAPIGYDYEFYLLRDDQVINAFALPGGQIFITAALFSKLENEDQLAGVLGHEIGHVIARHSNEQMSKAGLLRGIGSAVGVAVGGDSAAGTQQVAAMVNHVLTTKYGRGDEYHSDEIGVRLMHFAGYDAREILGVMRILQAAGGAGGQPEMLSTHPFPGKRMEQLKTVVLPKLGIKVE